ncbi:Machado-Joseph disease-like family protein [Hibiscus syriacus]|uniref:RING-type E3 ubiquitin transferase n=1 Tax=Hibiscus syriacus TaxID=106335 RepID=A0A6A3CEZ2_HIBSY|nr:E3 ubiquitin-protein ligase HAKAI homolog [Hibiscus syriacus]KAE8727286.1 Machado-Joseph disease-like family protein [Hibiscus syriacus]
MLQIRLSKGPSSDAGGSVKSLPVDTVTVACPNHLVLADLPVAKSIGAATSSSLVKTVGRRSRRQLGERVHFCVRCDFPIAIYGRLSPCEHAFCLDCARSDSICYLCDERIQRIQTIKIMEGIFICAAPHCLKSFLKRTDFESHIHTSHTDLLQPNAEKEDGKESEVHSGNQPTGSDSTVRGPPRPVISPGSNLQLHDAEDKARWQQPREQLPPRPMMPKGPPAYGLVQNYPSEPQLDSNQPPGFDRTGPHHHFQQGFDRQGTPQPESSQLSDKSQGHLSENQFSEYPPMHSMQQPPNFAMPKNSNPMLTPYGVPPFSTDGTQPFYGAPPGAGSEQGSFMSFPPGPMGGVNYPAAYPRPWNGGQTGVRLEATPGSHMMADGFANYQGDYGRNPGGLPMIPPQQSTNKGMEAVQGGNAIDPRDGVLAPQSMQVPPPPHLHHMSQHKRGKFHPGDMSRDGQGFGGWQQENRDGFAGRQK